MSMHACTRRASRNRPYVMRRRFQTVSACCPEVNLLVDYIGKLHWERYQARKKRSTDLCYDDAQSQLTSSMLDHEEEQRRVLNSEQQVSVWTL